MSTLKSWAQLTYASILEGVVAVKRTETTKAKMYALLQVLALLVIFAVIVMSIIVCELASVVLKILEGVAILFIAGVVWVLSKLGVF